MPHILRFVQRCCQAWRRAVIRTVAPLDAGALGYGSGVGATPILLVHGAWHGLWCWDGFRERLAARGREVRAVELRGHDGRPGRLWHRISTYVEDVARAAEGLAAPPVVVGHSLGGLVVQRYMEGHHVAGGVLMASIPTGGTLGFSLRTLRRHPLLFATAVGTLSLRPMIATPARARDALFTADTPQRIVDGCHARLQDESFPGYVDTLMLRLPRPRRVSAPVLVVGAERDNVFTVAEVRRTARAYGTEARIFPSMGHDMMLDTGWEQVADAVDEWVDSLPERPAPG